jgi:hypothetical protein
MTKKHFSHIVKLSLIAFGLVLIGGISDVVAQRDPFEKPGYARPKPMPKMRIGKDGKPIPVDDWSVPPVEQRIDFYKRLRAAAAANGGTVPKVTSVLTLNEMAVTGIFRTPRGYAAMVEAVPIKLSYTIYPGEKFFDGQLVAVEENQLIFKRVTKTGKNKFASSVVNMALRKYTDQQVIEGTAPTQTQTVASATPSLAQPKATVLVSPVDEMNSQPAAEPEKTSKQPAKKPAKIARNK